MEVNLLVIIGVIACGVGCGLLWGGLGLIGFSIAAILLGALEP